MQFIAIARETLSSKEFVIEQWCRDNIGPGGEISHYRDLWSISKYTSHIHFTFKDDNDYMSFLLRWGISK